MSDNQNKLKIHFFDDSETQKAGLSSQEMVTKISYKNIDVCLFDGMRSVHFDPGFEWDQVRNCAVLVLPEQGKEDEIIKLISAIRPQKILFTRHYFRYEKNKIPALMQLNFPEIEYHRTAENGAITCEADGENLKFDFTIR